MDPLFFYSLFLSVKGKWVWESLFCYSLMIGVKRFFQTLQDKRVFPDQEDKLLLKESKDGIFLLSLYTRLRIGLSTVSFPSHSI